MVLYFQSFSNLDLQLAAHMQVPLAKGILAISKSECNRSPSPSPSPSPSHSPQTSSKNHRFGVKREKLEMNCLGFIQVRLEPTNFPEMKTRIRFCGMSA